MDPVAPAPAEFWQRKLAAFLHDPPTKALNIPEHREKSVSAMKRAGFDEEWIGKYDHEADHTAAAADRVPFPASRTSGLACVFDGVTARFHHPFDGKSQLRFPNEIQSDQLGTEIEQNSQPANFPYEILFLTPAEVWRARFFAHWRLWYDDAIRRDWRLGYLPADTRIPDHTIWTHMQIVSALAGCGLGRGGQAAFLRVQLGGVQEFIAAARSTRDLWSGSYLISWLMAHGMKALAAEIGPDAVLFPNLRGQPLFDLLWRDELWGRLRHEGAAGSIWDSYEHDPASLLTPSLPSVFLAVVAAKDGARLGKLVAEAVQGEWKKIADRVWSYCDDPQEDGSHPLTADEGALTRDLRRERFFNQVENALSVAWQVQPWETDLDRAQKLAHFAPPDSPLATTTKGVATICDLAERSIPAEHRDDRNYQRDGAGRVVLDANGRPKLDNVGAAWSIFVAHQRGMLDAVRQTHAFAAAHSAAASDASRRLAAGTANNKDALTGREEAVAGGNEWLTRCYRLREPWSKLFKKPDWVGALTLIKRTWHFAYLTRPADQGGWGFSRDDFKMPNTRGVAAHEPMSNLDDDDDPEDLPPSERYFAVLAFDGDEMGKWISGARTPPYGDQLADYRDASGAQRFGSREYFERRGLTGFLESRRALSPSYHLQFSEALSNFALRCARPIVEAFDGRLIYAGGDDVVALLPADTALPCAQALRMAFRGDSNIRAFLPVCAQRLFEIHETKQIPRAPDFRKAAAEGRLLDPDGGGFLRRLDHLDQQNRPIPFIVPGPAADCSVGIAMAHFKAPLQDVVRAAQAAEKRAKNELGRSAVAISLFKRSGEILEWGSKWDDGGLDFFNAILDAMVNDQLSAKFPHRLGELIEAYLTDAAPLVRESKTFTDAGGFAEKLDDLVQREFVHVLSRQHGSRWPDQKEARWKLEKELTGALARHLEKLKEPGISTQRKLRRLTGLLSAVAFAHRTAEKPAPNPTPKGN